MLNRPGHFRITQAIATFSVAIAAFIPTDIAAASSDEPPCRMHEEQLRRGGVPMTDRSGSCPTYGTCDLPEIRDGYGTGMRPITFLRMHINVFRNDDGSNPAASEAEVIQQMERMNLSFAPHDIQFTYTWRFVDDTEYRHLADDEREAMKSAYALFPQRQCNVYVTGFTGGVGYFPWWDGALTEHGGIIINGGLFGGAYHTLVHEMGHNLGLWHTHRGVNEVGQCSACYEPPQDPNDTVGDYCSDTPPRPADFGLCAPPGGRDTCTGRPWGDTQPENFMSYGSTNGINCRDMFTPQQAARMHCWIHSTLSPWIDCSAGPDCDEDGTSDACAIATDPDLDLNLNGIPDACECPADLAGDDATIDVNDLLLLLGAWGSDGPGAALAEPADVVDVSDLLELLAAWGPCR